jgi:Tfp pilus assembly PilM family ATPase
MHWFHNIQPLVAIDLGQTTVRALALSRRLGRYNVSFCCLKTFDSPAERTHILRAIQQEIGSDSAVITAMPHHLLYCKRISCDARIRGEALYHALVEHVSEATGWRMPSIALDFIRLNRHSIRVVATTRVELAEWLAPFNAASLSPAVVEMDAVALARATRLLSNGGPQTVRVLHANETHLLDCTVRGGRLLTAHSTPLQLDLAKQLCGIKTGKKQHIMCAGMIDSNTIPATMASADSFALITLPQDCPTSDAPKLLLACGLALHRFTRRWRHGCD